MITLMWGKRRIEDGNIHGVKMLSILYGTLSVALHVRI